MNLLVNSPILSDYKSYHSLILDTAIQDEFPHFRGQSLDDTKLEIENWVNNKEALLPSFLRMIRLTSANSSNDWDESNSILIGFIANTPAGMIEHSLSGFKMLINFGIKSKYTKNGIMTAAMEMTLDWLYELGYNIVSAQVKPNNIGSQRVLEKCKFDLIRENPVGKTYVKALCVDMDVYRNEFGL